MISMRLDKHINPEVWQKLMESINAYMSEVAKLKITPESTAESIRSSLASLTFEKPILPTEIIDFVVQGLRNDHLHVSHPRYFGLFNPPPTPMGIAADALVAAFNPQLATWIHSPFSVEVEQHLIRLFGKRFGYKPSQIEGTFTSGGTEANHTALLTALTWAFPEFIQLGLRGLNKQPTIYVSTQSHHSVIKSARLCGLGQVSVRQIPVDKQLKMDLKALSDTISQDRSNGCAPFLVVATAGTTNAGVIDPLQDIAEVASRKKLWYHIDAAWGGAAAILDEHRFHFKGIELADSITFDAHKWLFVPMGAGVYLTQRRGILRKSFFTTTTYMPPDARKVNAIDPYTHSMQCSRRFIGLKVFLSLAVAGWDGYCSEINRQIALGHLLRQLLMASGWKIVNQTILPLICFVDKTHPKGDALDFLTSIQEKVVTSGKAWISVTRLKEGLPAIRACINNFRTEEEDIHILVNTLNKARERGLS
jgi:glutamate/tyrosine decarboxylase-like PLP-dependent enzyme